MRKTESKFKGLTIIVGGLALFALVLYGQQLARLGGFKSSIEYGVLAGMIVAWALILFGAHIMRKVSFHYRRVRIASIFSILSIVMAGILLFQNLKNEMGDQAYIDVMVMFMAFMPFIFLFYSYSKLFMGQRVLLGKKANRASKVQIGIWVPVCILFIVTVILVPISSMLSKGAEYGIVVGLGGVNVLAQWALCLSLLKRKGKEKEE